MYLACPQSIGFAVTISSIRACNQRASFSSMAARHKRFEAAKKSLLENGRFPVDRVAGVGFQNGGDFVFSTVHGVSKPVDQYYRSNKFKGFDPATQADKRSVLNRFCQNVGELPYAALRKKDIEASQDRRRAIPAAADKLVKYLRALFVWAIKEGHATFNPADGIERIHETIGWHTWSSEDVEQYRLHYALETKAQLSLEIFLNVGARISDAAWLGRQHEANGRLRFVAHKGRGKNKTRRTIDIPVSPELRIALSTMPSGEMIVTDAGRPFTTMGLGNR
jgi:integrase